MLQTSSRTHVVAVDAPRQGTRSPLSETLFWAAGIVLAFVIPLFLVLAAVFVSSWGIPLPFEVRIP